MKYRRLDSSGDYVFGQGDANFLVNTPEAVAQAVSTRLQLWQGEWFLDTSAGTPYELRILGAGVVPGYDLAIQEVILNTEGVTEIVSYASSVDPSTRAAKVVAIVNTVYGQATIEL